MCLFIDDNPDLVGKSLGGIRIISLDYFKAEYTKLKIETLLLAIPSNINTTRQRIFDLSLDRPLRVKTMPSISNLISGRSSVTDLEDINV